MGVREGGGEKKEGEGGEVGGEGWRKFVEMMGEVEALWEGRGEERFPKVLFYFIFGGWGEEGRSFDLF